LNKLGTDHRLLVIAWVAVGLFVYGLIVVLPSGREQEDVSPIAGHAP
jgi:hypothetical protein